MNSNHNHQHGGKSSELIVDTEAVLELLDITPGQCILDAGCGNGYMTKLFSELTGSEGKVYAVDTHEDSIENLKSDLDSDNTEVHLASITEKLPIEDASVDLVYISNVFHGFTDGQISSFKKETSRILKPSGRLAVLEFKKEDTGFGPALNIRYTPEELEDAVGIKAETCSAAGSYNYLSIFRF
ncbi:Ubiquinone/menaquinone biosynthesis methyltransferase ubiE [Sedimentisphaera cyanobacteriorum]|uniref:Ubiquinone/menaquinone biosynthesis methyltransferase ubiE n=1 Tax=Sedimentisphaera cyanobacteriorum TaxID=1940790 RepID=A0A1Q2HMS5_9BACT|nr:class I SAM-dependent methyltransferase [Sedimentisphaera cyanobacteriorum]AQQ08767.1 Ubiquinone/menaquinone biosynthesis methyltransferase ubiE [Sedimentisphaera cyanobacteriorum]